MRKLSIALTAAITVVASVSLFGGPLLKASLPEPIPSIPCRPCKSTVGMERDTAGTGIKSDTSGTGITASSVGSSAVSDG